MYAAMEKCAASRRETAKADDKAEMPKEFGFDSLIL
jgi:hypothetical protein